MMINGARLQSRINEVNQIGYNPEGISRLALTDQDKQARDYLVSQMKRLGLEINIDEIGNVFGIFKGKGGKYIGMGSHLDTVPNGGKYDGTLGVCTALEVVETLIDNTYTPEHSIVVCNFTNEEGVRFTPDMMGSMAYANPEKIGVLLSSTSDKNVSVKQALQNIGYSGNMKCGAIPFRYFIELHIEQGPILEAENVDIGIVQGVQGIYWAKVSIEGVNAHAGTTPMAMRTDPFQGFVALNNYLYALVDKTIDLKVTTGQLSVHPNAINVIPQHVEATLDIRHPEKKVLNEVIMRAKSFIRDTLNTQNMKAHLEQLVHIDPISFDNDIVHHIQQASQKLGFSYKKMISGAGHDAQLLADTYPAAMVFIPSKNGISHNFSEYSSPDQIEKGANVLLETVTGLDRI